MSARLILASRSPQRRAILEQLRLEFDVLPADVDELHAGDPARAALENARRKARAVAALDAARGARVLGADTVVALDGRIYGKPRDAREARAMLHSLSGRAHEVHGGVCIVAAGGDERSGAARTLVRFREFDQATIDWYAAAGEWRGRAGGYAIQGAGAALVRAIEGDYSNVVGLPVALLVELLGELARGDPQP